MSYLHIHVHIHSHAHRHFKGKGRENLFSWHLLPQIIAYRNPTGAQRGLTKQKLPYPRLGMRTAKEQGVACPWLAGMDRRAQHLDYSFPPLLTGKSPLVLLDPA